MWRTQVFLYFIALAFKSSSPSSVEASDEILIEALPNLRFEYPVYLTHSPRDQEHLYVLEQKGRIKRFKNLPSTKDVSVFLDITDRVECCGEEGLLGLAFSPDFDHSGLFYTYYTRHQPRRSVISEWKINKETKAAIRESERILFEILQPYSNHNGGMIEFGSDGPLYIGTGDGGSAGDPQNNAQNSRSLLGKILTLDLKQKNPKPEVYAIGLRNPWRFSFDPKAKTLWVGDVGQNRFEEIDLVEKGDNLGWRAYEGHSVYDSSLVNSNTTYKEPLWVYGRIQGGSITGGYVYRGEKHPSRNGRYYFGDYVSGNVWFLSLTNNSQPKVKLIGKCNSLSSFGIDGTGEIYLLNHQEGKILKIQ